MMSKLADDFEELYIEGQGFMLDYKPWYSWASPRGSKSFFEYEQLDDIDIDLDKETALNENGDFYLTTVCASCPECGEDVEIEIYEDTIEKIVDDYEYEEDEEYISYKAIGYCDGCCHEYELNININ